MTQVIFDPTLFRERIEEYSDSSEFPDSCLQIYWDIATCYVDDVTNCLLDEKCLQLAIQLMTAHLLDIGNAASMGSGVGPVEDATIDDVSVKIKTPSFDDDIFNWWINSTERGKQFYALMYSNIVGGIYVGGSADIQAFRGALGAFNA